MDKKANRQTAIKLLLVSVGMFGFGYALVPLYDVFCDITGLNGKTGEISVSEADRVVVDTARLITVEFDTNVNSQLPWEFKSEKRKMLVHPGEINEAIFYVRNLTKTRITAQAVPSVAPSQASLYFNKTECFCFTNQMLEAGEYKAMPVRFVVDPGLPESIQVLTLSYTFFPVSATVARIKSVDPDVNPFPESS